MQTRIGARLAFAAIILCAHGALAMLMMRDSVQSQVRHPAAEPLMVEILEPQRPATPSLFYDEMPTPHVDLVAPELPAMDLPATAALDPPKIDPAFAPDMTRYTESAQLPFGQTATILLVLDIAADGSVITARVVRSSGNAAANHAAVEYAYATRWIAGTVDGEPRVMQAALTVILGELA